MAADYCLPPVILRFVLYYKCEKMLKIRPLMHFLPPQPHQFSIVGNRVKLNGSWKLDFEVLGGCGISTHVARVSMRWSHVSGSDMYHIDRRTDWSNQFLPRSCCDMQGAGMWYQHHLLLRCFTFHNHISQSHHSGYHHQNLFPWST